MRLRTAATAVLASTALILGGTLSAASAASAATPTTSSAFGSTTQAPAARETGTPMVTSVALPQALAVSTYQSVPVKLTLDVPEGVEVASVYAKIAVNGKTFPEWELVSVGSEPSEYQNGTFPYSSREYGIGDAEIVATKIVYYPDANSASEEVEQTGLSNTMSVKQAVIMTASVYRYSGSKRSEASATVSYYDVAKQEYRDAKGFVLKVEQQVVKKVKGKKKKVWVKVTEMTVGGDGQVKKAFTAKSMAKSLYRISYKGSSSTTAFLAVTSRKI